MGLFNNRIRLRLGAIYPNSLGAKLRDLFEWLENGWKMRKLINVVLFLCLNLGSVNAQLSTDNESEYPICNQVIIGLVYGVTIYYVRAFLFIPILVKFVPDDTKECQCTASQHLSFKVMRAIIGSTMEEVFFRCNMQPIIRSYLSEYLQASEVPLPNAHYLSQYTSVFVTSILFGISHILNPRRSCRQVINATVGGFFYSYIYNQYGSVAVVISHITYNIHALAQTYWRNKNGI